jgi:hypothetical protein
VGTAAAVAGISGGVEGNADAIAVSPGIGGECGDLGGRRSSGAFKRFAKDGLFEGELRGIVGVLLVATAAEAEVRAAGSDALSSGSHDLDEFGGRVAGFVLGDSNPHVFTGKRERNEYSFAIVAGEEVAAVDGLFYFNEFSCVWCSLPRSQTRDLGHRDSWFAGRHCWLM